ncbi:hypothetical protein SBA6_450005 [Candidatus Sulfopaludibacter sp. SbA6]|nr:hypothetical protein SBA6_450005 [Candidatus Sulfopaludibacter sp. SbA6]
MLAQSFRPLNSSSGLQSSTENHAAKRLPTPSLASSATLKRIEYCGAKARLRPFHPAV